MEPVNTPAKFEVRIALRVPEIIGTTQKIGQSLNTPTLPFLQFFMGLCSDGRYECVGQICSP